MSVSNTSTSQTKDWESIFEEHYPSLRRYVYRLTGNSEDTRDIIQETFCRWLKINARSPRLEISDYSGYLRALARRLIHYRWIRERRERHLSLDDPQNRDLHFGLGDESISQGIELRIYHRELVRVVPWHILLAGFAERDLQILLMSVWEDMTHQEIARTLNEAHFKVRISLQKSRHKLRYRLKTILAQQDELSALPYSSWKRNCSVWL